MLHQQALLDLRKVRSVSDFIPLRGNFVLICCPSGANLKWGVWFYDVSVFWVWKGDGGWMLYTRRFGEVWEVPLERVCCTNRRYLL